MTSAQIYGLAAPFVLAGLNWALVWQNAHVTDRRCRGGRRVPSPAAE